jgi:type II secretory pathway component GspD/PulD (secretin)
LVTQQTVNDGQTIVLTGFTSEEVIVARDKVPVLGDVPLLGRLFRHSSSVKTRKNLFVLVTPTLIYPDGARYNSDLQLSRLNHGEVSSAPSEFSAPEK